MYARILGLKTNFSAMPVAKIALEDAWVLPLTS